MPGPMISIDFAHTMTNSVGPTHGLTIEDIKRADAEVADQIQRIKAESRYVTEPS